MALELSKEAVISQVAVAAVAGTTALTTSAIDMAGFDACCFYAALGTVTDTSVLTLTAYENASNANSGGTAITNAVAGPVTASTSSNTGFVVDVIRPSKRYVYATLTRTVANAVLNGIHAMQYRASNVPVAVAASITSAISSPEV